MSKVTASGILASAVADAGTFAISYPARPKPDPAGYYDEGDFYGMFGHKLVMAGTELTYPDDFDLTFGTSTITITNKTGASWATNASWIIELATGQPVFRERSGSIRRLNRTAKAGTYLVTLGAPDVADADGVAASQTVTGANTAFVLNGALVSGGVAVFDVPRNVVAAWTNTAVLTITGKDAYGNTIVEQSASGTSHYGSKAFKTVTSVTTSATVTSATVGSGNVLGLPFRLPSEGFVHEVIKDGVSLPRKELIQGEIDQTRLMAGTSVYAMNAHAGIVERLTTITTTAINTTGGAITVEIGGTAVDGLSVAIANGGGVGDVDTDTPSAAALAANSNTTAMVAARGGIEIVGDSAFDSTGAINYLLELNARGVFTAGAAVAGGQVATSADVRGTFRPASDPDGNTVWQLLVSLPEADELGQAQYTV